MELVDSTRDTALARLAIREVQKGADRQASIAFIEEVASGHWSGVVQREARKALERMR